MAYKIIISPIAIQNIDAAVAYYAEKVNKKVAFDFLNDFKRTLQIKFVGFFISYKVFYLVGIN